MTDNQFHYGNCHIFTSRGKDNVITLKAGPGETLNIDGLTSGLVGGNDTEVQFNDNGVFAGDSNFTFDKTNKILGINNIHSQELSDTIGLSPLQNELNYYNTQSPTETQDQGTSLSIGEIGSEAFICLGAPKVKMSFDNNGGVLLAYNSNTSNNVWADVPDHLFTNTAISSVTPGVYSDINEDCDRVLFSNTVQKTITKYYRNGSTWFYDNTFNGGFSVKVSGTKNNYYAITCSTDNLVRIFLNGVLEQTLQNTVGSGFITILEIINSNTAFYVYNNTAYIWTRVNTTWTNIQTIDLSAQATITSIAAYNNLLVVANTSFAWVYARPTSAVTETYVSEGSITLSSLGLVTTNETYVFISTSTAVKIYSKVLGTWTAQTNDVSYNDAISIACSENFLVVAKGNNESSKIFKIDNTYENALTPINKLTLGAYNTGAELESVYNSVSLTANTGINLITATGDTIITSTDGDTSITSNAINLTSTNDTILQSSGRIVMSSTGIHEITAPNIITETAGLTIPNGKAIYCNDIVPNGAHTLALNANPSSLYCQGASVIFRISTDTDSKILANNGTAASPSISYLNCNTHGLSVYSAGQISSYSCGGTINCLYKGNTVRTLFGTDYHDTYIHGENVRITSKNDVVGGTGEIGLVLINDSSISSNVGFVSIKVGGTNIGAIYQSGGNCIYANLSDYRLKENIEELDPITSINKIKALRPVSFKWKNYDSVDTGFIAHEYQQVFPNAVVGEKDGINNQMIDKESCLADLVKCVQFLLKENEELRSLLI